MCVRLCCSHSKSSQNGNGLLRLCKGCFTSITCKSCEMHVARSAINRDAPYYCLPCRSSFVTRLLICVCFQVARCACETMASRKKPAPAGGKKVGNVAFLFEWDLDQACHFLMSRAYHPNGLTLDRWVSCRGFSYLPLFKHHTFSQILQLCSVRFYGSETIE